MLRGEDCFSAVGHLAHVGRVSGPEQKVFQSAEATSAVRGAMYTCIVKVMICRVLRHHPAGNMEALLKFCADECDVGFLPGKIFRRRVPRQGGDGLSASVLSRRRPRIDVHEILASRWPWNATVCIRVKAPRRIGMSRARQSSIIKEQVTWIC